MSKANIDIYFLNTSLTDVIGELEDCELTRTETERLETLGSDSQKLHSLGAIIALCRLLDSRGIPKDKPLFRDESGKPRLLSDPALPLSISHSQEMSAAALGDQICGCVGLDVEVIRDVPNAQGIAKRFFTPSEYEQYRIQGESTESFFRIWTAKEARAKAIGAGLSSLLSKEKKEELNSLYLKQFIILFGELRLAVSVCSENNDMSIKIISEEQYEIQD